jgi:cytochrome c556
MIRATLNISSSLIRFTIAATLMVSLCLASAAQADNHGNDMPLVKYRQTVMSIIGGNMGAMADIMKNRLDLPGHVAVHAMELAEMAQLIGPAFKKNVATNATDAKPEIWQDWAKFEGAIADFEEAARNLETAAAGSDPSAVGPAMKALGKSCGGCHDSFRKPKEESFKRKSKNDDHDHDHE